MAPGETQPKAPIEPRPPIEQASKPVILSVDDKRQCIDILKTFSISRQAIEGKDGVYRVLEDLDGPGLTERMARHTFNGYNVLLSLVGAQIDLKTERGLTGGPEDISLIADTELHRGTGERQQGTNNDYVLSIGPDSYMRICAALDAEMRLDPKQFGLAWETIKQEVAGKGTGK